MPLLVLYIIVLWIANSVLAGYVAGQKGYDARRWSVIGFAFGVVGLLAVLGLPTKALLLQDQPMSRNH